MALVPCIKIRVLIGPSWIRLSDSFASKSKLIQLGDCNLAVGLLGGGGVALPSDQQHVTDPERVERGCDHQPGDERGLRGSAERGRRSGTGAAEPQKNHR